MIVYRDIIQGTPEWYAIRAGVPTASGFDKIVTSTGKPSSQRQAYLYRLAGEKILGMDEDNGFESAWMARGKALEEEAADVYAMRNEVEVEKVGFCLHDSGIFGGSPDGLIGDCGGIEIKCPSLAVHVKYALTPNVPTEYYAQVQGYLLVTGRDWWDFWSYYPGLDPVLVRAEPDPQYQAKLKDELYRFCDDLEKTIKKLKGAT